ncbi:MAG: adenylyltransferase/cytidyltransferase family protein [Candidatus Lindowbacteria bacterium]|nr:adenylyltransferase/cytidyltransferase family protein [Candidatus Lindowbacteria bacterium]
MRKFIKDRDTLGKTVDALKKQGKRIVLANGCFDMLHVGHIRYLYGAKREGDVLVVAVNSDKSMVRLGKPNRPVISEGERIEILDALEMIDYLTLFDEPTVDSVILELKPHVHAKGTDYTKENVPERETVLSYGGEIAIVGDEKRHSSTAIIEKIANSGRAKEESEGTTADFTDYTDSGKRRRNIHHR